MTALTPYDRGERAEPAVWVRRTSAGWTTGQELPRRSVDDDFGRVDFDDDAGATVATVWVEKNAEGQHVLHVYDFDADEERTIVLGEPA